MTTREPTVALAFGKVPLRGDERPRFLFTYYVTGSGPLPTDMLRHDGAWPADGHADLAGPERRTIHLMSYREPTVERWHSFLWAISACRFDNA